MNQNIENKKLVGRKKKEHQTSFFHTSKPNITNIHHLQSKALYVFRYACCSYLFNFMGKEEEVPLGKKKQKI